MQALSHFSYHTSSGQFVLCDLQGAVYKRSVVLTDPVIHSRNSRFGATDMGVKGIEHFFHHHHCNEYCSSGWQQPRSTHSYFPVRTGTSMVGRDGRWIAPTRHSRAVLDPRHSHPRKPVQDPIYGATSTKRMPSLSPCEALTSLHIGGAMHQPRMEC